MPKMKLDSLRGIAPAAKVLKFDAEDKEGNPKEVKFYIYPFTVKEKIEMKQLFSEVEKIKDPDAKEQQAMELQIRIIYTIISKSIDGFTMEDVDSIPSVWYTDILNTAMSFEDKNKTIKPNQKK